MATSSTIKSSNVLPQHIEAEFSSNSSTPLDGKNAPIQIADGNAYHRRPRNIKWVMDFVGVSKPTIYRWESQGLFPKRTHLGANKVAWIESDVMEWLNSRVQASRAAA